jgi:hypothetical protein
MDFCVALVIAASEWICSARISRIRSSDRMIRWSVSEYKMAVPWRLVETRFRSRRIFRWRDTDDWGILSCSANSLTKRSLWESRYRINIRVLSPRAEQIRSCNNSISCSSFLVSILCILLYSDKRIYDNIKTRNLQGCAQMYNLSITIKIIGEILG